MFEFLPYLFMALAFGCGYLMGMLHMLIWTPLFMKYSAQSSLQSERPQAESSPAGVWGA